jgi:hypothetical protein
LPARPGFRRAQYFTIRNIAARRRHATLLRRPFAVRAQFIASEYQSRLLKRATFRGELPLGNCPLPRRNARSSVHAMRVQICSALIIHSVDSA